MNYMLATIGAALFMTGLQYGQPAVIIAGVLLCACGPLGFKNHVMRLRRDGTMISDPSGWTVTAFGDRYWIVCFGEDWRRQYPTTWAAGIGRTRVWWYEPKPKGDTHGRGRTDNHD